MTIDSTEILVPARAYVYLAPTGTVAPATSTEALDPAWVNVGLTTPDSLSFSTQPQFQDVNSHQSDFPTRRFQTSESAAIQVDLQQWNAKNLIGVFGGGSVTEPDPAGAPGEFKFTPPAFGVRDEKSAILEVIDGSKNYRWIIPRCMQDQGVQADMHKGQEQRLPLRLTLLGDDGADPYYVLSNDPGLSPA